MNHTYKITVNNVILKYYCLCNSKCFNTNLWHAYNSFKIYYERILIHTVSNNNAG